MILWSCIWTSLSLVLINVGLFARYIPKISALKERLIIFFSFVLILILRRIVISITEDWIQQLKSRLLCFLFCNFWWFWLLRFFYLCDLFLFLLYLLSQLDKLFSVTSLVGIKRLMLFLSICALLLCLRFLEFFDQIFYILKTPFFDI